MNAQTRAQRARWSARVLRAIHDCIKSGGRFASAEISGDLDTPKVRVMLEDWEQIQTLMGGPPQSLTNLGGKTRGTLGVLPPEETETLWRAASFAMPIPCRQAFMIRGWHAVRTEDARPRLPPIAESSRPSRARSALRHSSPSGSRR